MASLPQSQEYIAQQPMSLLRVGGLRPAMGTGEDESNLLTIRILEASERKMRMIKELLSPEQFQSLSSDLFAAITPPHHTETHQASEHMRHRFRQGGHEKSFDWPQPKSSPPFSKQVEFADEESHKRNKQREERKMLSKSETNLEQSSELPAEMSSRSQQDIQENLAKKRQAVEFFFGGYLAPGPTESLAIELRFGHYLRANLEAEDKIIQEQNLSGLFTGLNHLCARLVNLFLGLMNFLSNICLGDSPQENANDTTADPPGALNLVDRREEEFKKRHKKFNGSPYSSGHNLATFVARLGRDQQLDKLLGQARPVLMSETRPHEQTTSASEKLTKQLILIKLDSDHSFRAAGDLNRRVLSLERAHSFSPGRDLATESRFLMHHPLVVRTTRMLNKQTLTSGNSSQARTGATALGPNVVALELESLKLLSHKWELHEEILARKLQDEFAREYLERLVKPLEKVVGGINELAGRIASEFTGDNERPLLKLMDRIFSLVEIRAKLLAKISAKQRKLAMIWNELRTVRDEQAFNSTSVALDLGNHNDDTMHDDQLPLGSLDHELLTQSLDHLRELILRQESEAASESQDLATKHLKRWQKFVAAETSNTPVVNKNLLLRMRLLPDDLLRTSDQDCPQEELKRRQRLEQWLSSLELKLILNDDYHFDLSPTAPGAAIVSQDKLGQRQVDLTTRASGPIELKLCHNSSELKLGVVVYERSNYSFLPAHLNRQLATGKRICEATFSVPLGPTELGQCKQRYELALEVPRSATSEDDTDQAQGQLTRLSLVVTLKLTTNCNRPCNSRLNTNLIDHLHSIVFDDAKRRRNAFEDTQTRARKLLNQVNARVLLALMGKLDKSNPRSAKFCLLNPHFRAFSAGGGQLLTRSLPNASHVSLRHALLVWRWATGKSDPVCLSDRENLRTLTGVSSGGAGTEQLLDKFRSRAKLKGEALKGQPEGYKLIEQTRALALDYIRQCELLIDQIIGLEPTTTTTAGIQAGDVNSKPQHVSGPRTRPRTTRDLLIEPRLNWLMARPNLPSVAQIVRALVPRPTARRPLMPDRRRRKLASAGQFNLLGQLVDLSQVRRLRPARATSEDLEGQALNQWRQFASGRKLSTMAKQQQLQGGSNLRLVVTIQQALNVPYRLAQSSQQPVVGNLFARGHPPMRSSSPLFSPSPMIGPASPPPLALSPIQVSGQQQQLELLEPATTYVEVVFQRHQLASSLAQGTSPAWNETLFFDVDLEGESTTGGSKRQQQLADEFLHLNLYDCRAYIQNDAYQQQQFTQAQPFGMQSLLTQRMQQPTMLPPGAQHQRIERHLIGSLQVPISVLLTTSGRIEGSFVLNQPLLLEHAYQFDQSETMLAGGGGAAGRPLRVAPRTSLSLFITLDPPVSLPMSQWHLPTGSHERADLFEYARLWERIMLQVPARLANRRRQTSGRNMASAAEMKTPHIRALVLRDDARYCLACRFLAPLKPPESLMQDDEVALDRDQQQAMINKMRRLARFVSLLSPLKQGHFQVRSLASSLWFDSRQLLHDALGGQEEKAVLLCNYFLHLGKCAGLLLVDCIPHGRSIYVLVWSSSDQDAARATSQLELQVSELMETLGGGGSGAGTTTPPVDGSNFIARLPILIHSRACQIWDPETGVCHRLTTGGSPLPSMSIGSIVTPENIYANLQQQQQQQQTSSGSPHAAQVNLDIRQRNLWFPLFSMQARLISETGAGSDSNAEATVRRESRRLLHVHNWRKQLAQLDLLSRMIGRPLMASTRGSMAPLDYSKFTREQCQELRDYIERQIKSNLLIWRPTRPTYFNRTLSRIIAEKLASFERSILGERSETEQVAEERDQVDFDRASNDDSNWWRAQLAELIRTEILDMPTLSAAGLSGGGESQQVISWPINLAYTSVRVILDSLYASGVHNADLMVCEQQQLPTVDGDQSLILASPNLSTQFLVACHVEPYPARTMSVWLYVGAIVTTTTKARRVG